jgi:hypothetical protein
MFEPILTALSIISNAKTALELTSSVARYILRKIKTDGTPDMTTVSSAEERQALEATYKEWEHIAISIEPAIERVMERRSPKNLFERAEVLASLAKAYAAEERSFQSGDLEQLSLYHTAFTSTQDGKVQLKLGLSDQTKCLSGETIDIPFAGRRNPTSSVVPNYSQQNSHSSNGGRMPLPVFKVTMLGDSGSGKTVFMSSMYEKMRYGENGIAIRAISHNVNLDLSQNIENLYAHDNWPTTNEGREINYEFALSLNGQPLARIEWVDYRGGAIWEREETHEGQALIKSLQNSHSIICMIDMSKLGKLRPESFHARTKTRLGHMANLCRSAAESKRLRSILFVRTKSDEVQHPNGEPDWTRACEELERHLGSLIDFDCIPFSAVIPVSSVGRVGEDKKLTGDEPYNVEWPLILSLAFMIEADLEKWIKEAGIAQQHVNKAQPFTAVKILKEILNIGMSDAEQQAWERLSEISRTVIGLRQLIDDLVSHRPGSIKLPPRKQR